MAMVVLWPKMKAPQRRVTAPQTVRMTLEGTRWSVTPGVNAARISEISQEKTRNHPFGPSNGTGFQTTFHSQSFIHSVALVHKHKNGRSPYIRMK